ncbi:hypothetical protein IW139_001083 [Coemansia sp. RSA 353]|nr:hypothetical protein GGH15_002107 [Coemansia sp. RSA 562]KAJ2191527.1 hypothetical protein EV181_000200 [Coemansia sp. RSA 532]KAJ2193787.1 hypothetical protein IW144_004271 [Coemansia sp. RSA 522]KAJ2230220.1 hypothetical protein EV180_001097 [Coemansia sp. RSA 518]KAJ2277408.1 hypothetical protein GGH14_003277 [Coemansia sp. RSA 370]KAJ2291150.1 hypothetical protein IW141_002844 [Coemansia sp. RSA 355]KAJ2300446.1 hypothetical protein IW139_001083 [Coemansia sp. RSA 353]
MHMRYTYYVLLVFGAGVMGRAPCDSPIYCQGDLLHTVQMAKLFADDKTFVDRPMLQPEASVLAEFARIGGANATRAALELFVEENFGSAGYELQSANIEAIHDPSFLDRVQDPVVQAFGRAVHGMWGQLVRVQDLSRVCPNCSSMLELKHRFVVPGGRFVEPYYWDTYFALEGVLRSGLHELATESIRNLLDLVTKHGFVPNGARVYYLSRSQPPLLALMVKLHYEFTHDASFVCEALPVLRREHDYWMDKHKVNVLVSDRVWELNRYFVDIDVPRPESYSDDYELARNVSSSDERRWAQVYADITAAAESGWDFSSRWVREPDAPSERLLQTIRTRDVVPVDFNAILYQTEMAIAELAVVSNDPALAADFWRQAETRHEAIDAVMLDHESGLYFDYILSDQRQSRDFTAASLWPYWAFNATHPDQQTDSAFNYVNHILDTNPGGLPATLRTTGQQWDAPMAWPPQQYVAMQSALSTNHTHLAQRVAQMYVNSVFCAWYATGGSLAGIVEKKANVADSGHMFEKFDSTRVGSAGGGGEYTVQDGFGWTNGVLLWVLDKFGHVLSAPVCPPS